jgi:DNA-binding CsgD family transcriptional regulator/tetratricopeptide (TPR) repeat protein
MHDLAGRAEPGSAEWCTLQYALGGVLLSTGDLAGAMEHCAAMVAVIGDQEPTPALVEVLNIRSVALSNLDQAPEGYQCARRALTLARELGYASGAAEALKNLAIAASCDGDMNHALEMARQVTHLKDIPGGSARAGSKLLAGVLIFTGDFVGAEQVCVATLASARAVGHLSIVDALLSILVQSDLLSGRLTDAAAHLRESVQLMLRMGDWFEIFNILDGCGHLCVGTGRFADAVTAWAARASFAEGMFDSAWEEARREVALRKASQALGPDRTRQAAQRGAVMSRATVADFVLMLTAPDPLPSAGQTVPGNLSARESELVTLVAQGRTDAEIAAQLYISIRTVRSHLDRIRHKTGCRRRADLTRLALSTGLL